ncbi:lysoplasmalogenase [Leucobacter celer]|uniref:lysoplasmalogenase n=1 Tax=Leucobacter celer TaxID=668625 RepID=UPI0006A79BEE|nr:lysoplasmalogenase [Leucobacter celer]
MTPRSRALLPFAPYAVVSAVHVVALFLELPIHAPTKLLLMPALALGALWAAARPVPGLLGERGTRGAIVLLVAAIAFSWLGDGAATFFPMFDDELPMMLLCFGLAHVGYVLLMWRADGVAVRRFPAWALVYVGAYAALMALLVPHTGSLTVPVMIYGLLLVATAAVASRCGAVIAWGGAWFLVSDAILAFRIFVPEVMPAWTSGAVMLTYTLGQGLIVAGIVAALRRRRAAAVTPAAASAAS